MKSTVASAILMAVSAEALLNVDVNLPLGLDIDIDLFGNRPTSEPCYECIDTWHPPHDVEIDECDDTGNGGWHWVHPCQDCQHEEHYHWSLSTATHTYTQVSTVVDCGPEYPDCIDGPTATTITVSEETTVCPVPVTEYPPVAPTTEVYEPPTVPTETAYPPPVYTQPPPAYPEVPPVHSEMPPPVYTHPAPTGPDYMPPPVYTQPPATFTTSVSYPEPPAAEYPPPAHTEVIPPPVYVPPGTNTTYPPPPAATAGASQTAQRAGVAVAMGIIAAALL